MKAKNLLLLGVGVCAFLALRAKFAYSRIRVAMRGWRVQGYTAESVVLRATFAVTNPTKYNFIISQFDTDLYLNGEKVGRAICPINRRLAAHKTITLNVALELTARETLATVWNYFADPLTGAYGAMILAMDGMVTIDGKKINIYNEFTLDDFFGK